MRLKTITAANMATAMARVRAELGDEAIIVSSREDAGQVELVAAVESEAAAAPPETETIDAGDPLDALRETLDYHRAPAHLIDRLYGAARVREDRDALAALRGALEAGFVFRPLGGAREPRPLMLVGPPGAGKTVTFAKLAARAALARQRVAMIATDTLRAGAVEQVASYAGLLKIVPRVADGAGALADAVAEANGAALKLIDTAGSNPFDAGDLARLRDLAAAANAEPILVLPAGMDPDEAAETAEAFAALGAARMIATRLDTARRLGGVLAAAAAVGLRLCEAGIGPHLGDGLAPLSADALARALMLPPDERLAALSPSPLLANESLS